MKTSSPRSQAGFTLPEVLIVILIIGILASIALPTFIGHRDKGYDLTVQSDASQVASQMEQCHVETDDFGDCNTEAKLDAALGSKTGASWGNGDGQVQVQQATPTTFRLRARSRSGANYTLTRPATGPLERTCNPPGRAGCPGDGNW